MTTKRTVSPIGDTNLTTIARLKADPANRRRHPDRNVGMITTSLRTVGPARSIVIDEHDTVLAGSGVLEAAPAAGISKVRIIDADGDTLIAVRRRNLTDAQKRDLAIFDNRTSELSEWDDDQLSADKDAGLDLRPFWTEEEETALLSHAAANAIEEMAEPPGRPAADPTGAPTHESFSVPLTVEQERIVRGALRIARGVFNVTTTADALTAALNAWVTSQPAPADV